MKSWGFEFKRKQTSNETETDSNDTKRFIWSSVEVLKRWLGGLEMQATLKQSKTTVQVFNTWELATWKCKREIACTCKTEFDTEEEYIQTINFP